MKLMKLLLGDTGGKPRRWLLGILALAFVIRLVFLFGFTDFHSSFSEDPYPEITNLMMAGQGFSKDFGPPGGVQPVTNHGPLYPVLSAGILVVSGHSWMWVKLAQIVLSVAAVLLVYRLGRLVLGETAALIAAGLSAIYLPLVQLSTQLMTETLFTFLLALSAYLCIRLLRKWSGLLALWLGVVMGLLILTKPKGLFIAFVPLPLLLLIARKRGLLLRWAAVPLLVSILVYSPWVVRNSLIERTFLPFGSGFGEAVIMGQRAKVTEPTNLSRETAGQRSESRFSEAVHYVIDRGPVRLARTSGQHFLNLWFNLGFDDGGPSTASIAFALANFVSLAVAGVGAVMLFRRAGPMRDAGYVIVSFVLMLTAVHLGTLAVGRYAVPMMPLVFVLASLPLARLLPHLMVRRGRTAAPVSGRVERS